MLPKKKSKPNEDPRQRSLASVFAKMREKEEAEAHKSKQNFYL